MKIKVKSFRFGSHLPMKEHDADAGFDLRSSKNITIQKGIVSIIPLCYGFEIPKGYYGKIAERSSMSKRGMLKLGGTIDSGFTGEVSLICTAVSKNINITKGERIAQIIFVKIADNVTLEEVEEFKETERGCGKFGSTNKESK